jgi:hypothetical protein
MTALMYACQNKFANLCLLLLSRPDINILNKGSEICNMAYDNKMKHVCNKMIDNLLSEMQNPIKTKLIMMTKKKSLKMALKLIDKY